MSNVNTGLGSSTDTEKPEHHEAALSPVASLARPKLAIWKNVIVISTGFLGLFGSLSGIVHIQSSVNKQLGVTSLWTIYISLVVSCAFLPTLMIKKFGEKWTMSLCLLGYTPYIMAQFYPRYYTLIPAALIMGLAAAPMWSAKCTYLTQLGKAYATLIGEVNSEAIITRLFGIFFMFFHCASVWGNLVTSLMLSLAAENKTRAEEHPGTCGADFCPAFFENLTATSGEEKERRDGVINNLSLVMLAVSFCSVAMMCIFVDPLNRVVSNPAPCSSRSIMEYLTASFRQMANVNQLLIIPLTMWSGWEQAFDGADYPAAFITCGLGVHMVGYVTICLGLCDSIFSGIFSPLVKRFGRIPIFNCAALINVCLIIFMKYWIVHPDHIVIFFVVAGFWGIADAVWQTQINAFYGVIFPKDSEAAFANYRLWESLGFIFAYVLSNMICVETKLYILLSFLIAGMLGYYTIEFLQRSKKSSATPDEQDGVCKMKEIAPVKG